MPKTASSGAAGESNSAELMRTATIARRYYLEGRSKIEIADEFQLSRFKVARILDDALASGIVRISIHLPVALDADLSDQLADRFGLRRAFVVDVPAEGPGLLRTQLGKVGADVLSSVVNEGDVLGVSWGRTLSALASSVTSLARCTTVQLTGVSRATAGADGSVELVRRLSEVCGGTALPIYAPLIVGDSRTAARLLQQDEVAEAMRCYDELDVAAISVGSWNPPDSLAYSVWPEPERTQVLDKGVVGEVCARLIDARGRHVEAPSSRRIIAISLDQLAKVPEVLLVSGGESKAAAIAAALASGFVTSLVTDVHAARLLMADEDGSSA